MLKNKNIRVILWCIVILVLMGIPGTYIPKGNSFLNLLSPDKIIHLLLFAVFSILLMDALRQSERLLQQKYLLNYIIISFGIVFGILTELLQYSVFIGRNGNVYDTIADSVGVVLGVVLYPVVQRFFPKHFSE